MDEGILSSLIATASIENDLHEEAPDDPERQRRILIRQFAIDSIETAATPDILVRLDALQAMLFTRGVDLQEIRRKIAVSEDVAPTPEKPRRAL